jgi:hypothetical protein
VGLGEGNSDVTVATCVTLSRLASKINTIPAKTPDKRRTVNVQNARNNFCALADFKPKNDIRRVLKLWGGFHVSFSRLLDFTNASIATGFTTSDDAI